MSSVGEIANAIRKLPTGEAHVVAQWSQDYLGSQMGTQSRAQDGEAFAPWRGQGHPPAGLKTDDYLALIRDGNGSGLAQPSFIV